MIFENFYFVLCFVFVVLVVRAESARFISERNLNPSLQITTASGVVQGDVGKTFNGRQFWVFRGIPYGKPPVGNLRFRPPKPVEPWQDVLDATKEGPFCVETLIRQNGIQTRGTEDCLILNVFTPVNPQKSKEPLPVLVWFHGGAFIEGNSSDVIFGPQYLLDEDMLVVSLNYRIGIFGFLSTEDLASPGNYGLKDQALALKWVQKNIRSFGGDPNRVTITGQSAGASSVFYHLVSPKSTGLFHRAIANSGSSLCLFGGKRNAREIAFKLAEGLNINTKSTKELVSKLRMVDLDTLNNVVKMVATLSVLTLTMQGFPFGPVIEPRHKNAFISESTYSLMKRGEFNRVPILMGITSDESSFFESLTKAIKPLTILYDISPGSLPNPSMNIASFEKRRQAGIEIINHYFKGSTVDASLDDIQDFGNDDQFVRPIRKTAQLVLHYVPVYFYVFSYRSKFGVRGFGGLKIKELPRGVVHGEDLTYIWKTLQRSYPGDVGDRLIISRMTKLWANFARTGNPTPKPDNLFQNITWPPLVSEKDIKYLNIDSYLSIRSNFRGEHMNFWDYIYDKYGGKNYISY